MRPPIEDPPNYNAERDISFEEDDFFTGYYLRLITLLQSFESQTTVYGQNRYSTLSIKIKQITFEIGLLEELFIEPTKAYEILRNKDLTLDINKDEQVSIGTDGTMVRMSAG